MYCRHTHTLLKLREKFSKFSENLISLSFQCGNLHKGSFTFESIVRKFSGGEFCHYRLAAVATVASHKIGIQKKISNININVFILHNKIYGAWKWKYHTIYIHRWWLLESEKMHTKCKLAKWIETGSKLRQKAENGGWNK